MNDKTLAELLSCAEANASELDRMLSKLRALTTEHPVLVSRALLDEENAADESNATSLPPGAVRA